MNSPRNTGFGNVATNLRWWRVGSAIGALAFAAAIAAAASAAGQSVGLLRVMTFNIWGGTESVSQYVDVIESGQADVVGFQEVGTIGDDIAQELGFHHQFFNLDLGIISRYPITQTLIGGVKLRLSPGQEVYVYDAHLPAFPYQPYLIRDGVITTEAQAIASAQSTRGAQIATRIGHLSPALASGLPTFFVGDFNEPSHLDWTQEAADADLNFGMKVDWPTSNAVVDAGLVDAFREVRPDEIDDRGETWTPGYPTMPANEVHDRIDFVYYTPNNVVPVAALTLGDDENDGNTDIGLQPYPSDHRAMVVEFSFPGCGTVGDVNSNCALDSVDWTLFRNGQHTDMTGLTAAEAYAKGDLNGDLLNNHADFVLFKSSYVSAHGAAAFSRLLAVPEPTTAVLAMWIALVGIGSMRKLTRTF